MDRDAVARQVELHTAHTRVNFEAIIAATEAAGVPLLVIRQPVTTWPDRLERGLVEEGGWRPGYEREYQGLERKLQNRGWLLGYEIMPYVHHHLIAVMDRLSREHGLVQVDNIALVSERPEGLGTRVHLTSDANVRLAQALAAAVQPFIELDQ